MLECIIITLSIKGIHESMMIHKAKQNSSNKKKKERERAGDWGWVVRGAHLAYKDNSRFKCTTNRTLQNHHSVSSKVIIQAKIINER